VPGGGLWTDAADEDGAGDAEVVAADADAAEADGAEGDAAAAKLQARVRGRNERLNPTPPPEKTARPGAEIASQRISL